MLPLLPRVDLGAMSMKGILCISKRSSITGASPLDCLVSYPGHSWGVVLPVCKGAVGVFYNPSRLGGGGVRDWRIRSKNEWILREWQKKRLILVDIHCKHKTRMTSQSLMNSEWSTPTESFIQARASGGEAPLLRRVESHLPNQF